MVYEVLQRCSLLLRIVSEALQPHTCWSTSDKIFVQDSSLRSLPTWKPNGFHINIISLIHQKLFQGSGVQIISEAPKGKKCTSFRETDLLT